jgi:predicted phosphodiesterase
MLPFLRKMARIFPVYPLNGRWTMQGDTMATVLVAGDLHIPAVHPGYLQFLKDTYKKFSCDTVVFIGDIIDHHAISFHDKNPELPSAVDEASMTLKMIARFYKAFPDAYVTIGNHDERVFRVSKSSGIPPMYLKDYNSVYGTHGWVWKFDIELDGVLYTHGTGWSGMTPAYNAAKSLGKSVVCGHTHANASINTQSNGSSVVFGMNVGCGVDRNHPTMSYGKNNLRKPVLSCGVVTNGIPHLELMKENVDVRRNERPKTRRKA